MDTSDLRLTPYHFRNQQMHEVDIVLERDDGMIVGIEVKASAMQAMVAMRVIGPVKSA